MLKKGFLRDRYPVKISSLRLWISIFFGVATALGLYFFFSVFRDVFRMMDFSISNGPLLIEKSERFWQNINFAMLSLVLGNSIAIGDVFKRPIKSVIPNYKRLSIQNDQTFFGFNFLYVFFKIYVLFGVFAAFYSDLKVITNYSLFFVLLSIAIFFESWKTILLIYRRKVYRFLLLNVLVLTILTFAFGQINMLDINKLDSLLLANNPRIELPTSSFHNEERNASCFIKIVKEDDTIKYFVDDLELSFEELPKRIHNRYRYELLHRLSICILAPYDIEIS